MNPIRSEDFEELVSEALDDLPEELARLMDNVQVVIETSPDPETIAELGDEATTLLGLYQGIPMTERSEAYFGVLPDRICLYKDNLEATCATLEELAEAVRVTVIHEIAHHFGIDDERLTELGWD